MTSPEPSSPDRSEPERLAEWLAEVLRPSSVIIGIGDELRGDDGAGVAVARRLAEAVPWAVVVGENAPENFTMKIAARQPTSVLLIDALHFGGRPGGVRALDPAQLDGRGIGTHGPGPDTFLRALRSLHPCRQVVLGIQPLDTSFGEGLTEPVADAVDAVVRAFELCAERRRPGER
ncbi:MAG: hydrogenase maturation protease [Planctomycetota bacterium]